VKERRKGRGLKGKETREIKKRMHERKLENRERFFTFRTRIRVARLLFIVAFYEGTGRRISLPPSLLLSSPPSPTVLVPPFFLAAVLAL
jgi:hypothetical protein